MARQSNGQIGRTWGVWNDVTKEFQFGIAEKTPARANRLLWKKIGRDAFKWRFSIRAYPSLYEKALGFGYALDASPEDLKEIADIKGLKVQVDEEARRWITYKAEMVYRPSCRGVIELAEGEVEDYRFFVRSYGTHPGAYVLVPRNHPFFKKDCMDIRNQITKAHGGLGFSGAFYDNRRNWCFGWDYMREGDFSPFSEGKRWTTREIVDNCLEVIEELKKYEKRR